VSEQYPSLRANQAFQDLRVTLEGTENRITVARNRYIKTVADYNVLARSFPNNLTGKVLGYGPSRPSPSRTRRRSRRRAGEFRQAGIRSDARFSALVRGVAAEPGGHGGVGAGPFSRCCTDRSRDRHTATLSLDQAAALERKLAAIERKSRVRKLVILIVGSTLPEDIVSYAQRVGDAWKPGPARGRHGVLIVVAKNDHAVRIAVAKSLEGAIPDPGRDAHHQRPRHAGIQGGRFRRRTETPRWTGWAERIGTEACPNPRHAAAARRRLVSTCRTWPFFCLSERRSWALC